MSPDAKTILRSIPGLDEPLSVTPLAGGITNCNYRVEAGQDVYVLRIAGENTAQLGIDRSARVCQRHGGGGARRGGRGRGLSARARCHAYAFCDWPAAVGRACVTGGRARTRSGGAGRLHAGPAVPGTFSRQVIADYHRLATAHETPLPEEMPAALAQVASLCEIAPTDSEPCPCHNDLLPGNLIDDGAAIRIIDWEYAGMGDRFFDLGNFAEHHELTPDNEEQLLAAYFGTSRREDMKKLRAMRRVSALREAMWGYAQAGLSHLEFDFLGYAAHHFQRFWTRRDA